MWLLWRSGEHPRTEDMNIDIMIYKYELKATSQPQTKMLPVTGRVRSVGWQRGTICAWVEFYPGEAPPMCMEMHTFWIVPTGVKVAIDSDAMFVGIVTNEDASLVFHVYKRRNA